MQAEGQITPGGAEFVVFRSLDEIPAGFGPTVAAVGNFDGVHLGHRAILAAAAAEARTRARGQWRSLSIRTLNNFCVRHGHHD